MKLYIFVTKKLRSMLGGHRVQHVFIFAETLERATELLADQLLSSDDVENWEEDFRSPAEIEEGVVFDD